MSRFVSGPGVIAAGRSDNSSSRNRAERPARALVLARGPWTSVSVHGGPRAPCPASAGRTWASWWARTMISFPDFRDLERAGT